MITSNPLNLTLLVAPSKMTVKLTLDSPVVSVIFEYWIALADVVMIPLTK